jgi:hypothetical protein
MEADSRGAKKARGPRAAEDCLAAPLARLRRLTPGDFATRVGRQRPAFGRMTAASLFAGLRGESAFKSGREGSGIGFSAEL